MRVLVKIGRHFRSYYSPPPTAKDLKMLVVDLRSDTVTKPTAAMRKAMAEAEVGDDVYKEDPTVNELERRCAVLFGMEATLFVPSGTMGNLISILTHCDARGSELIVGSNHHIHQYEQGGYAQLAGVACRTVTPNQDGLMDLKSIDAAIRRWDDPHETKTRLLCLENTHMNSGGRILPLDYHEQVRRLTTTNNMKIHLDGARLMNAAVGLNVSPKEILKHVDSVSMCFSKGLGCPVGSIVGGSKDFIKQAHRMRKLVGGGMRQVGVLAAAALHVLDSPYEEMIRQDHKNAKRLAEAIANMKSNSLVVHPGHVQTNIVKINTGSVPAQRFVDLLAEDDKSGVSVIAGSLDEHSLRLVTHRDVSDQDIDLVIKKIGSIVDKI